jgi:predicted transposase YbfD/YdcC
LLTVAVCAVIGGASSFAAITDWLYDLDAQDQIKLGFTRGVPAGTTVWRPLNRLDAALLTAVLAGWLRAREQPAAARPRRYRTVIAVDGKTLRGARLADGRQVHLLSALDTSTGIVLAQVTVDTKSNEIPAFTPLLDAVERLLGSLTGILFVADAMHTQTGHAQQIISRGAHLLLQAKGNQPTLFAQLKTVPWAQIPVGDRTRDNSHGRKETRTVKAVTLQTPGGISFPHAQQAARITRTRTIDGKTSRETAYLVTSLPATDAHPGDLQKCVRYCAARVGRPIEGDDAHDALRVLHRLSLISTPADTDTDVVRVHALIQRVVRESTLSEYEHDLAGAAAAINELWPEHEPASAQLLRTNVTTLHQRTGGHLWTTADGAPVLFRTGTSLGQSGLVAAARDYFEDLYTTAVQHLEPDHPDALASCHRP